MSLDMYSKDYIRHSLKLIRNQIDDATPFDEGPDPESHSVRLMLARTYIMLVKRTEYWKVR